MRGDNTLFLPGVDHAGIATQMLVERSLAADGITRHQLGREEFVRRVWEWKEKYGSRITGQMKRIGDSCDWSRERFTLSPELSRAVTEAFVRLYEGGLIYRGTYMVNWCPRCNTALSDLEVKHDDVNGHLWHIRYPVKDSSRSLVVATTRPETMLGDTAVAVNPKDPRYQDLAGKSVILPLMNREIPIIFDELAVPEFGTGVVKVTPAHDPNDLEAGKRHNLPHIRVIGEDARMTAEAGPYAGLDRFAARKRVVADLEKLGALEKIEDHMLSIGKCDRCGTIVEPLVSTQWFVKTTPMAAKAMAAVRDGRIRFVPDNWEKTFFHWMENIRDWVISRQLWWGHRIPAWHCADCSKITVAREAPRGLRPLRIVAHRAGYRCSRHLVQLQPLAVLHHGLAGRYERSADVLPDVAPDHRLRHPVLLGVAHDDDGSGTHRRGPVSRSAYPRPGARSRQAEDVEDQGQRRGSDGQQRQIRHRRRAACRS